MPPCLHSVGANCVMITCNVEETWRAVVLGCGVTLESPLGGHFGSRVTNFVRTTGGDRMSLVVTHAGGLEESHSGFPSGLVLSWVVTGVCGFLIGRCCTKGCPKEQPRPATIKRGRPSKWELLARRALHFLRRRRAISLAFQAYSNVDLRPAQGSRPNTARRALKQRAHTPGALRVLNEGPAVRRAHHGSHGGGTAAD